MLKPELRQFNPKLFDERALQALQTRSSPSSKGKDFEGIYKRNRVGRLPYGGYSRFLFLRGARDGG